MSDGIKPAPTPPPVSKPTLLGRLRDTRPPADQHDPEAAIGAGTDVAVETGEIVLIKSDPADALAALEALE